MTYAEQLRHPKWQRRRLEIMSRDGFACTRCLADDKTLNVHHKIYRKGAAPWEYTDDELATMCEDCHERQHAVADLPTWTGVICTMVDTLRASLSIDYIAELEKQMLLACLDVIRHNGKEIIYGGADRELAALRAADETWRRDNPDEAAAFDERKRNDLERIRAWKPH